MYSFIIVFFFRLKNVFLHVPSLHWIVVEDAEEKSTLVSQFLKSSGLTYTHLNEPTPEEYKLQKHVSGYIALR